MFTDSVDALTAGKRRRRLSRSPAALHGLHDWGEKRGHWQRNSGLRNNRRHQIAQNTNCYGMRWEKWKSSTCSSLITTSEVPLSQAINPPTTLHCGWQPSVWLHWGSFSVSFSVAALLWGFPVKSGHIALSESLLNNKFPKIYRVFTQTCLISRLSRQSNVPCLLKVTVLLAASLFLP